MADLKKFAEELVNLSVKDVNELATMLKDEYGIEPAAAVAVAGPAAGGPAAGGAAAGPGHDAAATIGGPGVLQRAGDAGRPTVPAATAAAPAVPAADDGGGDSSDVCQCLGHMAR